MVFNVGNVMEAVQASEEYRGVFENTANFIGVVLSPEIRLNPSTDIDFLATVDGAVTIAQGEYKVADRIEPIIEIELCSYSHFIRYTLLPSTYFASVTERQFTPVNEKMPSLTGSRVGLVGLRFMQRLIAGEFDFSGEYQKVRYRKAEADSNVEPLVLGHRLIYTKKPEPTPGGLITEIVRFRAGDIAFSTGPDGPRVDRRKKWLRRRAIPPADFYDYAQES